MRHYRSGPRSARAEYRGRFKLLVVCVKIYKQLEYLVHHLVNTGVGLIYLIDDHYNFMIEFKRLLEHEPRLGHRPLRRVDEKQNAVHHFQDTLDLSSEIGVTGSVDYIYLNVFVMYRGILCKYRYTAFSFKIVRVHDSFGRRLVVAVNSSLLQHLIHKCCLSVVNVSYYCYVANIIPNHFSNTPKYKLTYLVYHTYLKR